MGTRTRRILSKTEKIKQQCKKNGEAKAISEGKKQHQRWKLRQTKLVGGGRRKTERTTTDEGGSREDVLEKRFFGEASRKTRKTRKITSAYSVYKTLHFVKNNPYERSEVAVNTTINYKRYLLLIMNLQLQSLLRFNPRNRDLVSCQ